MLPSLLTRIRPVTAAQTLPLGVDLRTDTAYIVSGERRGDDAVVTRTLAVKLDGPQAITQTLAAEGIAQRAAVISLDARDVRTAPLPHGRHLPDHFHTSSAEHYAEELIPTLPTQTDARRARLVVDDEHATIVAVLESRYQATVTRARSFGLNIVAVDVPGIAWLRLAPDGIAVVGESPMFVARTSTGIVAQHAETADITTYLNQAITRARAERQFAADSILTTAPPGHKLYEQTRDIRFVPLTIADRVTPEWAFALALFKWSLA